MFYMHDVGWGWEVLMGIGMIAFWALVIFGIVWLIRGGIDASTRAELPNPPPATPFEILDRRLAGGEITIEEYHELRDALEQNRRAPA